jgi:thiol-disulfide isomerase/thioredoxin
MQLSTAALILVGALSVFDAVLIFAILRRLREHANLLRRRPPGTMFDPHELAGLPVPEFAVRTSDGVVVDRASLVEREHLVGFFTPRCAPCHEQAPEFVRAVGERSGAAPAVLAVVVARSGGADELREVLKGVPMVAGADGVELADRFGIQGYPTVIRTGTDGKIAGAAPSMRGLQAATPA